MKSFLGLLLLFTVIPCAAQQTALFPVEGNGKAGYIDHSGKIAIPLRFDEVRPFSEGLAGVRVDDDWGYIDTSGKFVIKPQLFEISPFSGGIASVGVYFPKKKVIDGQVGFYSYIDRTGKLITDERFGVAFDFSDGVAKVLTWDYKHVFIDRTGRHVFEFDTENFREGRARFQTHGNMPDSRSGYVDTTGKVVIPATYLSGKDFSEGLACVYTQKGAGFINADGKTVIDFKYDECRPFSEGLAAVHTDDGWGYIDKNEKMMISPKFAEVEEFSNGLAIVRAAGSVDESRMKVGNDIIAVKDGLFGVIDTTGQFVIRSKYIQMYSFKNGLAWVNLSDTFVVHGDVSRWGYINKKGEIVWKSF
jgi:hypothetical protein